MSGEPMPWWAQVLRGLLDYMGMRVGDAVEEQRLVDAGATPGQMANSASVSMPISGTGYRVEEDRAMDVDKLRRTGEAVMAKYPAQPLPGGGTETYCNWACRDAAQAYGCHDLDGKTANQLAAELPQLAALRLPYGWAEATGERAARHACRGGLAFAVKAYPRHGHIALVAPSLPEWSGSWARAVPLVYNVGPQNGLVKVSKAFPVADGEPAYFTWGETA